MFIGELVVRYLRPEELQWRKSSKQLFEVRDAFAFVSERHGEIEVGSGLVSDFASIPRLFKPYLDAEAPAIGRASIVHDYLYQLGGVLPDGRRLTRRECDDILREAMIASGARRSQAAVVYWAVWLGGRFAWRDPISHED